MARLRSSGPGHCPGSCLSPDLALFDLNLREDREEVIFHGGNGMGRLLPSSEGNHTGIRFERPSAWSSELWVAPMTTDVVRLLQVKVAERQDASPFCYQNRTLFSKWEVGNSEMRGLFLILIFLSRCPFLSWLEINILFTRM